MPQDASSLLAARILHDKSIITYRVLARTLNVHVDEAKRMMFAFHEDYPSPKTHATYLVAGKPRAPLQQASVNGKGASDEDQDMLDVTMSQESSEPQKVNGHTPSQQDAQDVVQHVAYKLAQEQDLEAVKATFEHITCIHIYSLEPGRLHEMSILVSINNTVHTDATLVKNWKSSNNGALYGVIQQKDRQKLEKTVAEVRIASDKATAAASASTSNSKDNGKGKPKQESDKKEKEKPKSFFDAKSSNKRKSSAMDDQDTKPFSKPISTSNSKTAKPLAKETVPSKDKGKGKIKSESTSDEMDIDEAGEEEARQREQEEADLAAMMEQDFDDDDLNDVGNAASKSAKENESSKAAKSQVKAPEKEESEQPSSQAKDPVPVKEKKRVRKIRKVKKTVTDDKGYKSKVDAEESYYETETDEEGGKSKTAKQDGKERPEKSLDKTKAKEGDSKKQPAPKKKTSGKPGEQTSMKSFFKKS